MEISARVLKDSLSPLGVRLTTFEVTKQRYMLPEFNTHRVLAKNSASSRAIPVHKRIEDVQERPAMPSLWRREQPGMQGGEVMERKDANYAEYLWKNAAKAAANYAEEMMRLGLHKSIVNRIMEPYLWHTVIVTGTAWENFFDQRCSPLAQDDIRVAAELMRDAYRSSKPEPVSERSWHLPLVYDEDHDALMELADDLYPGARNRLDLVSTVVSVARCARVSYLTHDGQRSVEADYGLYEKLIGADPIHWSPFEHVATPDAENRQTDGPTYVFRGMNGNLTQVVTDHLPRAGSLYAWRSLRTELEAQGGLTTFR